MAELFHHSFESDLSEVAGFSATNGTVGQSSGAALNATAGGVLFTRSANSPNLYLYDNFSLTTQTTIRTAWYTDLSALTIGTDNHDTTLMRVFVVGVQITALVVVRRVSGSLKFRLYLYNDSNVSTIVTVDYGLPLWLELRVNKASGVGVPDASAQLYAGGGDFAALGEQIAEATGVSLFTRFAQQSRALPGMHDAFVNSSSVGGSLKFDEWIMRNDDTPILFGVSAETSGRPYDLDQLLDLTTIRM